MIKHITYQWHFLSLIILCSLACVYMVVVRSSSVNALSSCIVYPSLVIQSHIIHPVKQLFERRHTMTMLQQQIATLQHDRDTLLEQTVDLAAQVAYAKDIAELVTFRKRYSVADAHLGRVLLKTFSHQGHFFLVEGGSRHGIQKDMVAVYKNNLVGKVTSVLPWYCKVHLITDRTCKVAACCASTQASGIHEGSNTLESTQLNYVSHLMNVRKGDIVMSSGDGLVFPQGFALGCITAVENNGLYYQVRVQPMIDFTTIEYCYLVQKS